MSFSTKNVLLFVIDFPDTNVMESAVLILLQCTIKSYVEKSITSTLFINEIGHNSPDAGDIYWLE